MLRRHVIAPRRSSSSSEPRVWRIDLGSFFAASGLQNVNTLLRVVVVAACSEEENGRRRRRRREPHYESQSAAQLVSVSGFEHNDGDGV